MQNNMFPERLRELRIKRNLSQEELGNHLDLKKQTISHYENAISFPGKNRLEAIANFFGVTLDYLLGRSEEGNYDVEKIWPEAAVVLRRCGKIPTESERRLIAKILKAAIEEIGNKE